MTNKEYQNENEEMKKTLDFIRKKNKNRRKNIYFFAQIIKIEVFTSVLKI